MNQNPKRTYRYVNRLAWSKFVRQNNIFSRPYGPEEFAFAREWLDYGGWIPWEEISSVLCLAAGGGQQGPLFASLGYRVSIMDLSPAQLQLDREVAKKHGFDIECIQGDMLDLSQLHNRDFDLVYQPISAHYIPNVRRLYRQVFRTLRYGGYYWVEHWSPFQMQLAACNAWDGEAYRVTQPQKTDRPVPWVVGEASAPETLATCWHYIHPLGHLIGGLCDAGFVILRFGERENGNLVAEPGSEAHKAAYLPPFMTLLAQRF